jgi:hypothetical protein
MHEPVEQANGGVLGPEPGPMDAKHQRLAMPSECCSVAAATTRNSSWIPMSFSGAKPDRPDSYLAPSACPQARGYLQTCPPRLGRRFRAQPQMVPAVRRHDDRDRNCDAMTPLSPTGKVCDLGNSWRRRGRS